MSGPEAEFPSQKHQLDRAKFGVFEVDLDSGELRKFGTRVKLQQQPFELLIALLEKPGQLVTREELRARLWPEDVYVSFDDSLNRSINKLRSVLGDQADSPRFIETIPRRGYRFIAPVTLSSAAPAKMPKVDEPRDQAKASTSDLGEDKAQSPDSRTSLRDVMPSSERRLPQSDPDPLITLNRKRWIKGRSLSQSLIVSGIVIVVIVIAGLRAVRHHAQAVKRWSDPEAHNLYLRSLSFAHDGPPNQQAIELLQQSVGIDPSSAEAWYELGQRYLYDQVYNNGGKVSYRNSEAALKKALSLDPTLTAAESTLALIRTESGDLQGGYEVAVELLQKSPHSAEAHFTMSYVFRYAGLLDASARECKAALGLEPHNPKLRTCAQTFLRLNDFQEANRFIGLDEGSEWAEGMTLFALAKQGNYKDALQRTDPIAGMGAPLLRACLQHASPVQIGELRAMEERFPVDDPEPRYHIAWIEALCGFDDSAVNLLRYAADHGYCVVGDLKSDHFWDRVRTAPGYAATLESAEHCQASFAQHLNQFNSDQH